MDMTRLHTKYRLNPYEGLPLEDARGRVVTCVAGVAWLTMEGDTRDVVLAPGESFTIDRDGLTLLAAQQPSVVTVSVARRAQSWWQRAVYALARVYGPAAIRAVRTGVY